MMTRIMGWVVTGIGLTFFSQVAIAQPPRYEEVAETIRFIRLAESKRQLDFSEEKLLKVNEALEAFEQKRFALVKRENELKRMAVEEQYPQGGGQELIDELLSIRERICKEETDLWHAMQTFLTPQEVIRVWVFYDRFQREVFKKIRGIQERRADRPPAGVRRRNPDKSF